MIFRAEVLSPIMSIEGIKGPQIDCDYPDILQWNITKSIGSLNSYTVVIYCDESILADIEEDTDYVVLSSVEIEI